MSTVRVRRTTQSHSLRTRLVSTTAVASLLVASMLVAGPASAAPAAPADQAAAPTDAATPVTGAVDADAPVHHWRLDEAAGGALAEVGGDRAGTDDLVVPASAVRGVPGSTADGDAATTFAGGPGRGATTAQRERGPQSFSLELGLRTTTAAGGKLVGLESSEAGSSHHYDRHLWMRDDGRVAFGVYDAAPRTVLSPRALNDGAWHQVVATYEAGVMRLYVDGAAVGEEDGVRGAEPFDGYWRVGGGRLDWWPGRPSSPSFAGDVDDVAVYGAPLSPERVAAHRAAAAAAPPPAAGQPDQPGQPEPGRGGDRRSDFGSYRPDASTTGSYGALERYDGDLTITTPGQVVEGLDVTGVLRIRADGVTVRRTTVRGGDRGPGYRGAVLVALAGDQRGALIEDVTVRPSHPVVGMNGVQVSSATVRRADVSGSTDGILAYGDDVRVEGSYVHDLRHWAKDPSQRDGSHDDALQFEGGARASVVGNSLSGGHNTGIMITQNYARVDGLAIDRNYLGGGVITLNTSEKERGPYAGFRVTDNRFLGDQSNRDGVQAVITATTRARATVDDNVLDTTGAPIKVLDAGS